jgi:hypothetical protein
VNRRIAVVLAALIVPGGLFALIGAALVQALSRTEAGRKAWDRVTTFLGRPPAVVHAVRPAA